MKFMFVYGTLMRGLPLNGYMTDTMNAKFVCKAKVLGFKLYASGIPFLVKDYDANKAVWGEVWAIDEEDWDRGIDVVDAVEAGYNRSPVIAYCKDKVFNCETYIYNSFNPWLKRIKSGNYRDYITSEDNLRRVSINYGRY